jgi:HTH-type transcriptional regulator / antitoxin HipB
MAATANAPTSGDPRLTALGAAVRRRRRSLGLNQRTLADLAGCSERFVFSLEHAKGTLHLAKVLDVLQALGLGLTLVPGDGAIVVPDDGAGTP